MFYTKESITQEAKKAKSNFKKKISDLGKYSVSISLDYSKITFFEILKKPNSITKKKELFTLLIKNNKNCFTSLGEVKIYTRGYIPEYKKLLKISLFDFLIPLFYKENFSFVSFSESIICNFFKENRAELVEKFSSYFNEEELVISPITFKLQESILYNYDSFIVINDELFKDYQEIYNSLEKAMFFYNSLDPLSNFKDLSNRESLFFELYSYQKTYNIFISLKDSFLKVSGENYNHVFRFSNSEEYIDIFKEIHKNIQEKNKLKMLFDYEYFYFHEYFKKLRYSKKHLTFHKNNLNAILDFLSSVYTREQIELFFKEKANEKYFKKASFSSENLFGTFVYFELLDYFVFVKEGPSDLSEIKFIIKENKEELVNFFLSPFSLS